MSRLCYEEVNLTELFKTYYKVEKLDTHKKSDIKNY